MHDPIDKKPYITDSSGFTLLELSIVLVVIGLVAAGILVGTSLIKSAEHRQLVQQIEQYNTAINAFKLKYGCVPGDCLNAGDFFDDVDEGNGDEMLQSETIRITRDDAGSWGAPYGEELGYVWQHLSAAQLVDGSYDGGNIKGVGFPTTSTNRGILLALNSGYAGLQNRSNKHYFYVGSRFI